MSKKSKSSEETAKLIFPHQLFERNPLFETDGTFFLIEEFLFFRQYDFHRQKLIFHRASMRFYQDFLKQSGKSVEYIESTSELSDIRKLIAHLEKRGFRTFESVDLRNDPLHDLGKHRQEVRFEEIYSVDEGSETIESFLNPQNEKRPPVRRPYNSTGIPLLSTQCEVYFTK